MKSVEDRLRELPEDAGLKKIEAGEALRRRILDAADKKEKRPVPVRLIAVAAAGALIAAVGIHAFVFPMNTKKGPEAMLTSQSAGDTAVSSEAAGAGEEAADGAAALGGRESAFLDLPQGRVSISNASSPEYRSIWARGSGANFPLVASQGRYYRLLTSPAEVSSSLLGEALGTVKEYTSEPALSSADTVSNICPEGTVIYAVKGMNGAAAAAEVDGKMRAFQRVSYAGEGLRGGERLSDTLGGGQVSTMELSGVGRLSGSAAREMWSFLTSGAVYLNASCPETGACLTLTLDNGLTLQMAYVGDTLSACGSWACPGFAEAFAAALR